PDPAEHRRRALCGVCAPPTRKPQGEERRPRASGSGAGSARKHRQFVGTSPPLSTRRRSQGLRRGGHPVRTGVIRTPGGTGASDAGLPRGRRQRRHRLEHPRGMAEGARATSRTGAPPAQCDREVCRRSVEAVMPVCPNCSAEQADEFCPRCGQKRIEPQDLSAREFWREMADDVTSFKTRFKTLRTLRGLAIPGFLTAEYLAGRRERYLSPFKTYLVCAATFFLAAPAAGFRLASMLDADRSGVLRRLVSARAAERQIDPSVLDARFDAHVQSV